MIKIIVLYIFYFGENMKKIASIIIIILLIICSYGVQGFSKQNNDIWFRQGKYTILNKFPSSIDLSVTDLPEYFSWTDHEGKDWTSPATQQLMGDCGVFSAIGALECIIKIREDCADINPDLSEQYILSCLPAAAIEYGKGCTYGVLPSNAYRYIMSTSEDGNYHNGVTWESCFPYQASDYSQGVTIDQIHSDWLEYLIPISDYGSIWNEGVIENTPESIELIKNMIIQHGPSVAAMSITSSFQKWGYSHNEPEEFYPYTGERWRDQLSHGVVIVGWKDDTSIANGGYWICKNSWGTGFGYDGFFNIEYGACFTGVLFEWVDYNPDDFYWPLTAQTKDIYSGIINENLLFDASGSISAEDSSIISYHWDFGDGNIGSGQSTYHSYPQEDIYLMNLTIIDDNNKTSKTSVKVIITSEPITIDICGGFFKANFKIDNPSNFTLNDMIYRIEPINGAPIILGKYSLAGKISINPGENIIPIGTSLIGFSISVNFRITIGDISKTEKIYVIGPLIFAPN
jgi:C1A family cysteine protease